MISMEKFFQTVEKIKTDNGWAMGLIIVDCEAIDFGGFGKKMKKISISEESAPDKIAEEIISAFKENSWIVLELKNFLPAEMYNHLKILAKQNRLQLPGEEIIRQPDSARIIVVVKEENLKLIEKNYPDFKYLFGPVIMIKN